MSGPLPLEALADLERGPGRALLEATAALGFSEAVARAGLEAEFAAWRAPGAVDAVLSELPADLDPARRPAAVLVIAAGTLPASTLRQVLMARLLGARVLLKPASGQEPVAAAIAAADPAVAVRAFASSDAAALAVAVADVDAVVVLGSDATCAAVAAAVPADKAFVGYGHRLSVAWLDEATPEALAGLAEDLCAWDQAGCLSPQVVWTREEPAAVLPRLAAAVRRVEAALPMALPDGAGRARSVARTLGLMQGAVAETASALLVALPAAGFRGSPGARTLWVLPAAVGALAPVAPHLSCLAFAGDPARRPPVEAGVRVCSPGEMQRPPLAWPHDGRANLLGMLRRV